MQGSSHGVVETQPQILLEENHGILIKTVGSLTTFTVLVTFCTFFLTNFSTIFKVVS
jgi:hypothetical protein